MHIGIDARLAYYQMGGITQYTLALIDALAALPGAGAHRWTVVHSRKETRRHVPPGSGFQRVNAWTPSHHRLERLTLGLELLPQRLDVLHSPDFIPPLVGARRRVITVHDLNFWYYPQFLTSQSRRYYGQIGRAVRAADAISADSEHTRQDLLTRLKLAPEKVRTIHLAANPLYSEPVSTAEVDAVLDRFRLPRGFVLFVGTLEPRKNIPTLLRAYHQLRHETRFDLPLVLVGRRGWLYEEIFETIRELQLGQCVYHVAHADNEDVRAFYHAAGVLALPSFYEGFGLPPLEAMHCSCPVIVSDRASLKEVVGDAGPRLEPDDTAAWAESLARMVTDGAFRDDCIARGRRQAAQFSWARAAQATLALYEGGA
jgi:glycosyltransferase involved in cell wall biosynthesis